MSHPILDCLGPRELATLRLVASSRSNKEMALDLGISVKTVEKHRQSLMNKTNCHDTAALTRLAIRTGVIQA